VGIKGWTVWSIT